MIVAPGCGFRNLVMSYEGVDIARRLNQVGVDAFVLKYRLTYIGDATPGPQAGQNVRELGAPMASRPCGWFAARGRAAFYRGCFGRSGTRLPDRFIAQPVQQEHDRVQRPAS